MYKQIQTLYDGFNRLNEDKFDKSLSMPVITIQAQKKGKGNVLGWCSSKPIWVGKDKYYEINITAEFLARPFLDVIQTLLHEMVHLSNAMQGLKDCSKKQNHNEYFREEAERVGLIVKKVKSYGYADTSLSKELKEEINKWDMDKTVFDMYRITEQIKVENQKRRKRVKYICPVCEWDVSSEYDDLDMICGSCGSHFELKSGGNSND